MGELRGYAVVPGEAAGDVVVLSEPLSFWGGFDSETGRVIGRHADAGASLTGRILVMPSGRGSSSSSSVLAEAISAGTGPRGIVLGESDPVIALGALVAQELYDQTVPVVLVDEPTYRAVTRCRRIRIAADGQLLLDDGGASSQNTL